MTLVEEVRRNRTLPTPPMARLIRVAAGVSQVRLAQELDVHRVTLARWEAGLRRPRGPVRARYAEVLEQLRQATTP